MVPPMNCFRKWSAPSRRVASMVFPTSHWIPIWGVTWSDVTVLLGYVYPFWWHIRIQSQRISKNGFTCLLPLAWLLLHFERARFNSIIIEILVYMFSLCPHVSAQAKAACMCHCLSHLEFEFLAKCGCELWIKRCLHCPKHCLSALLFLQCARWAIWYAIYNLQNLCRVDVVILTL